MIEPDSKAALQVFPECQPSVDALQGVLDGELSPEAMKDDSHVATCPICRERIAAARLMVSVLSIPDATGIPAGMADRVILAVREDHHSRIRHRSYIVTTGIGLALAASLLLVGWFNRMPSEPIAPLVPALPSDMSRIAPPPRPLRLGDEFEKVGIVLQNSSRTIYEPIGATPGLFARMTDSLMNPAEAKGDFEQARKKLAELPDAARTGLEPVTGTAQKAFSRLVRDFSAIQVSKPKS